jgi:hypothetical protein
MTVFNSEPFPVARAAELRRWVDSGAYARIIGGDYPRRDDDRDASVTEDVKAAAASYRDQFRDSTDPLVTLARKAAGGAADLAGSAARGARGWASGRGNNGSNGGNENGESN